MTSVSVAVMAHRVRAPLVEALVARLDRPAHVAWAANTAPSTAPEARWRTAAAAWSAADPGATHHLVLQDDAVVCRDLVAGLEAALDATPAVAGHPVSIYYGNHHGPSRLIDAEAVEAARVGASWVIGRTLRWGVAIVAPTAHAKPLVAWCERLRGMPYDARLARYFRNVAGRRCWYTWPGLVDHDDSVTSLVGHTRGRVAHRFCGRDSSALDLDWSGPIIDRRDRRR